MTVAARQPKVIYQGNGETVLWDIPFPFFNKEDVVVYVADESGKQTRLTGGYAVVREEEKAKLHYPLPGAAAEPLAPGRKLLLLRNTPLEQAENFEYAQKMDSDVAEKGYDAAVMMLQELSERLGRAVVFPAGYPPGEHDAAEYLDELQKTLLQAQNASAEVRQNVESAAETVQKAQEASVEGMAKIEAAGAEQVQAVNQAGTAQTEAVNTAGQTQLDAINTAGAQHAKVNKSGDTMTGTLVIDRTNQGAQALQLVNPAENANFLEFARDASGPLIARIYTQSTDINNILNFQIWGNESSGPTGANALSIIRPRQQGLPQVVCFTPALAANDRQIATTEWVRNVLNGSFGSTVGAITNCLTKIPQDIKLEVSGGTLRLKAGSKMYIPDGLDASGRAKFQTLTLEEDAELAGFSGTQTCHVVYSPSDGILKYYQKTQSGGASASGSYVLWYDVQNNRLHATNGSGAVSASGLSLPLGTVTMKDSVLTGVDQVFNGLGYIGSTVYALPGVSGVIAAGRREDGGGINRAFTVEKVLLKTETSHTGRQVLALQSDVLDNYAELHYDRAGNVNLDGSGQSAEKSAVGVIYRQNGQIMRLLAKNVLTVTDRNEAADLCMPSGRYVTLSLGASGSEYTAPAAGYFVLNKSTAASGAGQYVNISVDGVMWGKVNSALGHQTTVWAPARGGSVCKVDYNATGATNYFRFYYAEGEV